MLPANIKKMNLVYCLIHGFYWCAACGISTYAAFYLRTLGYSNTELGLIISLASLLAFAGPLVLSPLIDRSEKLDASRVVFLIAVIEICLGVYVFFFGRKGIPLSVVYVVWLGLCSMTGPMCTQIAMDYTHGGQPVNFGLARAFGSFAFVFASAGLGKLVENVSHRFLSAFAVIMCLCVIVCVLLLSALSKKSPMIREEAERHESSLTLKQFITAHPSFTMLLAGIGLIFMGYSFLGTYMINVVESLGGNAEDMGGITAFCAFMEIPSMLFFAKAGTKKSPNGLLIASFIFFSGKILFFYVAGSIPVLYISGIFQLLAYGMYTPAIVEFIRRSVPYKDSVKGQALAGAMCTFGSMSASIFGGILTDHMGVKPAMLVFLAISIFGTVISVTAVLRTEKRQKLPVHVPD